jgi:kumamolisin
VREFAGEHGLTIVAESAGKRTVELSGTVAQMNAAFSVNLERAELNGKIVRQRTGEIMVPASIANVATAVLGLDNRPTARPHHGLFDPHANPRAGVVALNPVQVAKLYGFPADVDGTGQIISIIELGGGFSQPDLETYFTNLSVKVPTVTAVPVSAQNSPGTDPDSDLEVMLDIEVVGGVAPGATQLVYFGQNSDAGFLNAVLEAIHATPAPAAVSISWGHPESTWTPQSISAFTQAFTDAGAMGIPCFVASGDAGSSDGTPALEVDFPASSPAACGCGGTTLIGSGSSILSEVAWNDDPTHSSGGGVSVLNPKPPYQASAGVPAPPSGAAGGRGVPDVSGHASAWQVFVSGNPIALSGTSAVAPLWAGLSGLLAQKLNSQLGFLNNALYASSAKSAFRDITQGTNDSTGTLGKYSAGAGWDPCTGLGSPNGNVLATVLGAGTPTPAPTPTPNSA